VIEEMGYIENDRFVNVRSYPTVIEAGVETMLEIRLMSGSDKW
jgi:hypothetical protein